MTPEVKEKFTEKLRSVPREFFGLKVGKVVRVYSEASSAAEFGKLSTAAKQWIFE